MREPVFPGVVGDLLRQGIARARAVSRDAPNVEVAVADRIRVDPFTVRRVVGAVVETVRAIEPFLLAAGRSGCGARS